MRLYKVSYYFDLIKHAVLVHNNNCLVRTYLLYSIVFVASICFPLGKRGVGKDTAKGSLPVD